MASAQSITLKPKRHIGPRNQRFIRPSLIRSLLTLSPNRFHRNSAARANSETYSEDEIGGRLDEVEVRRGPREGAREGRGKRNEGRTSNDLRRACI